MTITGPLASSDPVMSPVPFQAPRVVPRSLAAVAVAWSLASSCATVAAPSPTTPPHPWRRLFNGHDFEGIDRYLAAPAGTNRPFGLNHDPLGVFRVEQVDGRGAVRVSGQVYGALTTHASFTNVHVRLQYKWGDTKWPPRAEARHYRDAGLLYWAAGPDGAGSSAWQRSVECNIMEKGVGQWWSVDGVYCDVEGRDVILERMPGIPYRGESPGERCVVWQPGAPRYTVQPHEGVTSTLDPELPRGQWNTVEVVAWGGTCLHLLNGHVVLALSNPRVRENGTEQRLSQGRIQLQSEAAELWYRDLEARPIDAIPEALLAHVPAEPPSEEGFLPLLTGEASRQWAQCGPGHFTLAKGIATGRGGMGLWWYQGRTFTNFVLRGEWLQDGPRSDSGVFFRFPDPGNDPWVAVRRGHEFEIGDPRPAQPAEGTGAFYPFQGPATLAGLRPAGQWNAYELTCIGPNYALRINGRLVNTWTDPGDRPLSGYIGLQNYDLPDAVQHRRLRIKPLL